ncbi:ComEA family DNA-binding protein [Fructilactobacillus hinvesii]|uniref:ComEA family DNA-binding protein n=1 Tax=Fructilactobacillus hinvesii TaxID=2940300 RepID=A0ABY5BTG8_9LACO|nr:ComEA family DNA-binding protein [Fructilactobacillus hinvesii]USS87291.1 ComEA family DNA-binding protein [Fructilactobacillus hinvesii]
MERISEWWEQQSWQIKTGMIALALCLGLLGGGCWWLTHQASQTVPLTNGMQATSTTGAKLKPATSKEKKISNVIVDVKGAVKQPGVYRVAPDTRVDKVIQLAGGFLASADANQVNLAQKATDQSILYVPNQGEQPPVGPAPNAAITSSKESASSTTGASSGGSKINLNQADVTQLQSISGVGAKKAEKIIAYRQQTGSFKTVADLKNVPGFGAKTVTQLQDSLTV